MTRPPCAATSPEQAGLLTIGLLFDAALAADHGQEIVYADHVRHGYKVFGQRVHQLAAALARLGVRPGDTVGVMDWDTHRFLECFFAVPMMGAVLHTINVRLSPEQILYTINHAEDNLILVNNEFLSLLAEFWDRVQPGKTLVLLNDNVEPPATTLPIAAEYEAMLSESNAHFDFPWLDEDTRATTFYTSGTTGLPKGVYFSHRQLVLHTVSVRAALSGRGQGRFNAGDTYMPITPMFHVHAWGIPYVATMLGAKQVYPGRYKPERLLDLIQNEGVRFSHCVPALLKMLLDAAQVRNIRLDGLTMVVGGSAMPRSLCERARQVGVDVFTGYGMSETGPILTLAQLPHDMPRQAENATGLLTHAGRPLPLVRLRIVDAEMRDVRHDGVSQGEIVVQAPWLTHGYWKDEVSSRALWAGGWLHTGDIGVMYPGGDLRITDRIKDVIKSGGEWVSSLDVEDLILRHPAVADVAVIGVPDLKWGERPVALLVLKPGSALLEEEILIHLRGFEAQGLISAYAIPNTVRFVESLPRTSVGKLDKRNLRQNFSR